MTVPLSFCTSCVAVVDCPTAVLISVACDCSIWSIFVVNSALMDSISLSFDLSVVNRRLFSSVSCESLEVKVWSPALLSSPERTLA